MTYRREVEKIIFWLKLDLKLADIFLSARNQLCQAVTNESILSKDITMHFKSDEYDYPPTQHSTLLPTNFPTTKVKYLKKLITSLNDAEKAIRIIESIDLHNDRSNTSVILSTLPNLSLVINNLYNFIELVNDSPIELETFVSPIQSQIMPKVMQLHSKLNGLDMQSKLSAPFESLGKKSADILAYLPSSLLNEEHCQANFIEQFFNIPGYFNQIIKRLNPEKESDVELQLSPEELKKLITSAQGNLENFMGSTYFISHWFNAALVAKNILSVTTDIINVTHPLTQETYSNYCLLLNKLKHEYIPSLIHEAYLIEKNTGLKKGLLTAPLTQTLDTYYTNISLYAKKISIMEDKSERVFKLNQTLYGKAKLSSALLFGKGIPSTPRVKEESYFETLQDQQFIEKRLQLLEASDEQSHLKLIKLHTMEKLTNEFFHELNHSKSIALDESVHIPIAVRLNLSTKYKQIQSYLSKNNKEVDKILVKILTVNAQERLKLISECSLTEIQKKALSQALSISIEAAYQFIDNSDEIKAHHKKGLKLAINNEECLHKNFIFALEGLIPPLDSSNSQWSWYDNAYVKKEQAIDLENKSQSSWGWNMLSTASTYAVVAYNMAIYGLSIFSELLLSSLELESINDCKKSLLDTINTEISDETHALKVSAEEKVHIFNLRQDSIAELQSANDDTLEKLQARLSMPEAEVTAIEEEIKVKEANLLIGKKQNISLVSLRAEINKLKNKRPITSDDFQKKKRALAQQLNKKKQLEVLTSTREQIIVPDDLHTINEEALLALLSKLKQREQLLLNDKRQAASLLKHLLTHPNKKALSTDLSEKSLAFIQNKIIYLHSFIMSDDTLPLTQEKLIHFTSPTSSVSISEAIRLVQALSKNIDKKERFFNNKSKLVGKYLTIQQQDNASRSALKESKVVSPLKLFSAIKSLNLEEKIKTFREVEVKQFLQTHLEPRVYESLSIDSITYPIPSFHTDTQNQATYKRLLNSLHFIETSIKNISDIDDMGSPEMTLTRARYVKKIVLELISNIHSTYYYINEDQPNPKVKKLINQALAIISPLDSIPAFSPYIKQIRHSIKQRRKTKKTEDNSHLTIKEAWEKEMLLLRPEIERNYKGERDENVSSELEEEEIINIEDVIDDVPSGSTQEEKTYIEILVNAFYQLEVKIQGIHDPNSDEERIKLSHNDIEIIAREKANRLLNTLEGLNGDITDIQEIIMNYSSAICDISNAGYKSKQVIENHLAETSITTISKLLQIGDNIEVMLGLKNETLTKNIEYGLNQFYVGLFDSKNQTFLNYEQKQKLLDKRLKHQKAQYVKINSNLLAQSTENIIFGKNKPPSLEVIDTLTDVDFTTSIRGMENRFLFLEHYDKLQPYLSEIDFTYDKKYYLRELQTAEDFKNACIDITSHTVDLKNYVQALHNDKKEQLYLSKNQYEKLAQKKIDLLFQEIIDNSQDFMSNDIPNIKTVKTSYLEKYQNQLIKAFNLTPEEDTFHFLEEIRINQRSDINIYHMTQEMQDKLSEISHAISHEDQTQQHVIDKVKKITDLQSKIGCLLVNEPTPQALKTGAQSVYSDFVQAIPILEKFSSYFIINMLYDFVNYFSPSFAETLFIDKESKATRIELHRQDNRSSDFYGFFNKESTFEPQEENTTTQESEPNKKSSP